MDSDFLFTVCLYRQYMMCIDHAQEYQHLPFLHIVHILLVRFHSHNNSTYLYSERFHR